MKTTAMKLIEQNKQIPTKYYHNPTIRDFQKNTVAMLLAEKGVIPEPHWHHDPQLINNKNQTVAIILSSKGIIPPAEWIHDIYQKDNGNNCIKSNLQRRQKPVPRHWNIGEITDFDLACFGKVPEKVSQNPEKQNEDGFTVAMILACNGIEIPLQWYHEPSIQNNYGFTVSMIFASNGVKIQKNWIHKFNLKNEKQMTVFDILLSKYDNYSKNVRKIDENIENQILNLRSENGVKKWSENKISLRLAKLNFEIPNYCQDDPELQDDDGNTVAMILANQSRQIDKRWYHKPEIQNSNGKTVAMILATRNYQQIDNWRHDPSIKDKQGNTVAMYLCMYCRQIPVEWRHGPMLQNNLGYTIALRQAANGRVPDKEWEHSRYLGLVNLKQYYTVQGFLQKNRVEVPEQWRFDRHYIQKQLLYHMCVWNYQEYYKFDNYKLDPIATDDKFKTVALNLASYGLIPDRRVMYDVNVKIGFITIKDKLQENNLPVPYHWKDDDMTIFDQACFGIVPENVDDPSKQNEDGWTVAMILAARNIEIPEYLYHDPSIQNKQGWTVALIQASNKKVPDKQWEHDKFLRCEHLYYQSSYYYTVKDLLDNYNIQIPQQWNYSEDVYKVIETAINEQVPEYTGSFKQTYLNKDGLTVAVALAKNCIMPPQNWIHDLDQKYKKQMSIREILKQNCTPIPQHIQNDQLTIFDQACYGIVPELGDHKSDEQDEDGWTVAMILAFNNMAIPKQWEHDPYIQNKYGDTVAIVQARRGCQPNDVWYHNPYLANKNMQTVGTILYTKKIEIPFKWLYDIYAEMELCFSDFNRKFNKEPCPTHYYEYQYDYFDKCMFVGAPSEQESQPNLQNEDGWTAAMILAHEGENIPKYLYHKPDLQNIYGQTTAMILAQQKIIPELCWHHKPESQNDTLNTVAMILATKQIMPPKEWMHNPKLVNYFGETVAMILAAGGIIPPKEWEHDKKMTDDYGNTVGILLAENGLIPPKQWMHDIHMKNKEFYTIEQHLYNFGYYYSNRQFEIDCFKQQLHDVCQICFAGDMDESFDDINDQQEDQQEQNKNNIVKDIKKTKQSGLEFVVTNCGHKVCYVCFCQLIQSKNATKCPICRKENWIKRH